MANLYVTITNPQDTESTWNKKFITFNVSKNTNVWMKYGLSFH